MYGNRGFDGQGGFERAVPVKVGEELEVKIEAVGEKGDGIAKINGFVLFVPNTKENENVRIKVTKVLRRVGFADVIGPAEGSVASEAPDAQAAPATEPEPAPEDTEDFGEESDKDSSDDDVGADEPSSDGDSDVSDEEGSEDNAEEEDGDKKKEE